MLFSSPTKGWEGSGPSKKQYKKIEDKSTGTHFRTLSLRASYFCGSKVSLSIADKYRGISGVTPCCPDEKTFLECSKMPSTTAGPSNSPFPMHE